MLFKRLLLVTVAASNLAAAGCCSDPRIRFYVFHGARTHDECKALMQKFENETKVVVSCPGDTVTLCWDGKVETIDYGMGSEKVPTPGMKHISPKQSVTAWARAPSGSCAGETSVQINVPQGDQKYTMEARWDFSAGLIRVRIPEEFISPKLRAVDITGDWKLNFVGGTQMFCLEKPILIGQHREEGYNFSFARADETVAFSRPLRPAGTWEFSTKCYTTRPTNEDMWAVDARYKFNLTVRCIP
jgi:hypothetical protein